MRILIVCVGLTTGCTGFQAGFQKGFDKSFTEKCLKAATDKGAAPTLAKEYCDCALGKVNSGASTEKAAEVCLEAVRNR